MMVSAVGRLYEVQQLSGGTPVQGGATRKPSVREQIDEAVKDPGIGKEKKVELLKAFKKQAARDATLYAAATLFSAALGAASFSVGSPVVGAFYVIMVGAGTKATLDSLKERKHAGEALRLVESQTAQSQAQPQKAAPART